MLEATAGTETESGVHELDQGSIDTERVQRAVERLARRSSTLDELLREAGVSAANLRRVVVAINALRQRQGASRTREVQPAAPASESSAQAPPGRETERLTEDERLLLKSKVLQAFISFHHQEACELLGVLEGASNQQIEAAHPERAHTYAPWQLRALGLGKDEDKGRELFTAVARAYAELSEPESRGVPGQWCKALGQTAMRRRHQGPRIETDLLDPALQYATGMSLLEKGEPVQALDYFEFAADCEPRNPIYRAERAYRSYRLAPRRHRDRSIAELEAAIRIDSCCGLAHYYLGQLHAAEGDAESAEESLRRSIKLMAPDRRPIDALRELAGGRRK